MGKRGPRPRPTALKLARGNPGKRRLNTDEPKPRTGVGDCPDWLDKEGRASGPPHRIYIVDLSAMPGAPAVYPMLRSSLGRFGRL